MGKHFILFMVFMAFLLSFQYAFASPLNRCFYLSQSIDNARYSLQSAIDESDLSMARSQADRAKHALLDVADSARDCGCKQAGDEFDDSARHIRSAAYSDSAEDFVNNLNRGIRNFNYALDALKKCR